MAKKPGKGARTRRFNPHLLAQAMARRVEQRTAVSGTMSIPAVPGLADEYVALLSRLFSAAGRGFSESELGRVHELVTETLAEAFRGSPRSRLAVAYDARTGAPLAYEVRAEVRSVAAAYETWIGSSTAPLFGSHPDARVRSLAEELGQPLESPVLDIGAGTGRNALFLARRGHPVDAVELTPKFAELLSSEARREGLSVHVIQRDVFEARAELGRDYRLVLLSEVVPDFRTTTELRSMFELAADLLGPGGLLLFNVHLAEPGYTPDKAAREFAQQCYSALFTRNEVSQASRSLGLELVSDESVHDYERTHLPEQGWPPTPWYTNWVLGKDVYDLEREECPVEMHWLVYAKTPLLHDRAHGGSQTAPVAKVARPRHFDPSALRKALVRRLKRRAVAAGILTLPAVPGMLDAYVERCIGLFRALGKESSPEETVQARQLMTHALSRAFTSSARSSVAVTFRAPMGAELEYELAPEELPLAAAYEDWLGALPSPLFGAHPDARVASLAAGLGNPAQARVLDVGAGTGRNALALARRGHPVDAVELTPKLAELMADEARREKLPVRIVTGDFFEVEADLEREYQLIVLAGVASDFRRTDDLRRVFEFADRRLGTDGQLALSVHVTAEEYAPSQTEREWAEHCSARFYTREELALATAELGLALESDHSAHDYESEHLPEDAWPPTPWYPEWALGLHLYAVEREQCPIELRWLVYRKTSRLGT